MTAVSLFAGIGGFDLALERAGHQIIWSNEFNRYAADIYDTHFQEPIDRRDITTVSAGDIPDHDILCGGFPCQAFSVAGYRRGFDDTRGTLFFDIARILKDKRPRYCLLENVKGLLSHEGGRTFTIIIQALDELGYDLQWQVCNSKDFGVPQNRERVFIVGHLRGKPRPEIFPLGGSIQQDPGETTIVDVSYPSRTRVYRSIAPTVRDYGSGGNKMPMVKDATSLRRLTPTECERLQGFPDGWTAQGVTGPLSDTQRYKCLGNAVTVNVVEAVIDRLQVDKNLHGISFEGGKQ